MSETTAQSSDERYAKESLKKSNGIDDTMLVIGDRVQLSNNEQGEVKFIGPVLFAEGIHYGIGLDLDHGKHNGTVDKHKYFECTNSHGVFVERLKIVSQIQRQEVDLPDKGRGIVRFMGPVDFDEGIWYGIELNEKKGKTDGSVNQIQYFKCSNNCGTFIKEEDLFTIVQGRFTYLLLLLLLLLEMANNNLKNLHSIKSTSDVDKSEETRSMPRKQSLTIRVEASGNMKSVGTDSGKAAMNKKNGKTTMTTGMSKTPQPNPSGSAFKKKPKQGGGPDQKTKPAPVTPTPTRTGIASNSASNLKAVEEDKKAKTNFNRRKRANTQQIIDSSNSKSRSSIKLNTISPNTDNCNTSTTPTTSAQRDIKGDDNVDSGITTRTSSIHHISENATNIKGENTIKHSTKSRKSILKDVDALDVDALDVDTLDLFPLGEND
ncbi:hypothetical protein RFI_00861, partial [Reticulomyxa filosa]